MSETTEEAINPLWIVLIALGVVIAMLVVTAYIRMDIKGGWLVAIANLIGKLGL